MRQLMTHSSSKVLIKMFPLTLCFLCKTELYNTLGNLRLSHSGWDLPRRRGVEGRSGRLMLGISPLSGLYIAASAELFLSLIVIHAVSPTVLCKSLKPPLALLFLQSFNNHPYFIFSLKFIEIETKNTVNMYTHF